MEKELDLKNIDLQKMDPRQEHLTAQGAELVDEELNAAAGGAITYGGGGSSGPAYVFHYNCKRCGRLLHQGTNGALYCDPCNTWFWEFTTDRVYD